MWSWEEIKMWWWRTGEEIEFTFRTLRKKSTSEYVILMFYLILFLFQILSMAKNIQLFYIIPELVTFVLLTHLVIKWIVTKNNIRTTTLPDYWKSKSLVVFLFSFIIIALELLKL